MLIHVDHRLRIAADDLSDELLYLITEALDIPNIERQRCMEQGIWGWQDMPEKIALWKFEGGGSGWMLNMPRGFGFSLIPGLRELGIDFEIEDHRSCIPSPGSIGRPIKLRPWQVDALGSLLEAQEGIWKAPAGSGKTVGILEAIRRINTRSIVIVNTKDILWQWRDRAHEFLGPGFPVGIIGDNEFKISEFLTIATAQTLYRRFNELERQNFFDMFGFMCLDECHHATAHTYQRIVDRFSSLYRVGVSATPDKTGNFALATNILGPIFHETKPSEVSTLIKPEVFKVPTKFNYKYQGAKGRRPSNYGKMMNDLIRDEDRNKLITRAIQLEEGTHSLVISKRLEHLAILEEMVSDDYDFPILRLTGEESSADRQLIVEIASHEPCLIFSTLADEALDIPRLDRGFLVFPQRNSGLITQQVGRFERIHPDKKTAKIYDFCDLKIGPLENQWLVRRREVYNVRGYKVTLLKL